jgi:hypothetical protein
MIWRYVRPTRRTYEYGFENIQSDRAFEMNPAEYGDEYFRLSYPRPRGCSSIVFACRQTYLEASGPTIIQTDGKWVNALLRHLLQTATPIFLNATVDELEITFQAEAATASEDNYDFDTEDLLADMALALLELKRFYESAFIADAPWVYKAMNICHPVRPKMEFMLKCAARIGKPRPHPPPAALIEDPIEHSWEAVEREIAAFPVCISRGHMEFMLSTGMEETGYEGSWST